MVQNASTIDKVTARQIFDSRGRPTVEADIILKDGTCGRACAPSGASTGRWEACELRDGDPSQFEGLGVQQAIGNVCGEIAQLVTGFDVQDQSDIDHALVELDGSKTLSRLGANGVLATSMAVARAAANYQKVPLYTYISQLAGGASMSLPMPMTNILSGGAHARRGMDIQDFLVVPIGAKTYTESLSMISKVRNSASTLMSEDQLSVLLADEGGLSPGFAKADQALDLMIRSFETAGLRPGEDVAIALDVAASEFFNGEQYELVGEQMRFTRSEMIHFVTDLVKRYPIISIEDVLDQDDWEGWREFSTRNSHIQIVGDDLFATNTSRIKRGIREKAANAVLIKVNQNGTVTGALNAMSIARAEGFAVVVSARSGETEDTFIADLAVGTGAGQIKIGSVRNSERLAKYNQLLRIEEQAPSLPFAGISGFSGSFADKEMA